MINVKKKIMLICALSIVSLFSFVALGTIGTIGTMKSGYATSDFSNVAGNYYVVDGAYILCKDDAVGIKFMVVVNEDYLSSANAESGVWHIDIYSALADVCVEQISYTGADWKAVDDIVAQNGQPTSESGYTYSVYITYNNLEGGDYKTALCYELYIKAYVVIGGTTYNADSNDIVRSMREVAENAQDDPDLSEDEKDSLGKYYVNVSQDNEIKYYEKGDAEESILIDAEIGDGTGYKAFIGNTEVTSDVSFTNGALSFDTESTTFSKLKGGKKYYLTVADGTNVYSKAIMPVTRLLTQDNFVSAVSASTAGDYFILTEDVSLGSSAYANATAADSHLYAMNFNGTLDGLGHKISVSLTTLNIYAGLFNAVNGTMKNFEYEFDSNYSPRNFTTSKAFLAFNTNQSIIENAYIHIKVRASTADDGNVAILGYPANTTQEGKFVRCIFDAKQYDSASGTYVDAKVYLGGGAKYVKFDDCVFINGGETAAQFIAPAAAHPMYSATITSSYKYASMENFYIGEEGYACSGTWTMGGGTYEEAAIAGTVTEYDAWNEDGIWNFADNKIKLCGNTVYTYTARAISASIDKETLTITDNDGIASNKAYDVYVGETKIGSFTGTACNVALMLNNSSMIAAGANNITVTVITSKGRSAETTATFTATGLTQSNFVSAVSASTANDYFILTEDVSLGSSAYADGITGNYCKYAFDFNGTFDGMGHKIYVSYNDTTSGLAGLFHNINGTMRNFEYEIDAKYNHSGATYKGFFAFDTAQSVIENAYIHVKAQKVSGNSAVDNNVAILARPQNSTNGTGVGKFERCIFEIQYCGDKTSSTFVDGLVYSGNLTTYVTFNDCVFINGGAEGAQFGANTGSNKIYCSVTTSSYKYASMENFYAGVDGYTCAGIFRPQVPAEHTYEEAAIAGTVTEYDAWNEDGIWNFADNKIKLCGNTVYIYTARAISASIDKETLTITDNDGIASNKAYDVYVDETKIGSFTGTACNVALMLNNSSKIAEGANNITVTVITSKGRNAETTATFTATGLTTSNFVSAVSASTASDYFILTEDVSLGSSAYADGITKNYCKYAFDFNGTFDGMGHKMYVSYNDTTSGLAGLFHNINGTMRNFEYEIDAGYNHSGATYKGFFAFDTAQSVIENAYIHVKAQKVSGNSAVDNNVAILARPQNSTNGTGVGKFERCIFEIQYCGDKTSSTFVDGLVYSGNVATYVTFNDCVFINGGAEGAQFGANTGSNTIYCSVTTSSYKYATMSDFLAGTSGYTCAGIFRPQVPANHTYAEAAIAGTVTEYDAWNADGIWSINGTGMSICGRTVYTAE